MSARERVWEGLSVFAISAVVFAGCGGSGGSGLHPADGGGGNSTGGHGGGAGASTGGHGGGAGASTGGNGGGGGAGASAGGSDGGTAGAGAGGTGGQGAGDAAASVDMAMPDDARDAAMAMDVPAPAPATVIPAGGIDFGVVPCGSAGGTQPLAFTNSGDATLHYSASVATGGIFSLQGAGPDGSLSGDVDPGGSAMLTVVAGTVPTTTGSGATLQATLVVMTNAAGAENVPIALTLTAQGATCTLTCGSFTKCTPGGAAPYCANTATDNANCGTCGHACGAGEVCGGGSCSLTCGALTTCTPSGAAPYCANTDTESANCGTCGHVCGAGEVCTGGVCALACGSLTKCTPANGSPYCANTTTDNADCGSCGHACSGGEACSMGVCTATCSQSETLCNGSCTNTAYDPNNCQTCGHACGFSNGSAACAGGACYLTSCNAGYLDCDRNPTNGCEVNKNSNPAHCGACGRACALGETCNAGICTANLSQGLLGYWNMDDDVGSIAAADNSANHFDGLVQGGVTFVPGAGKQGTGAASFTGAGFIRVPFPNNANGAGSGPFIPQGNITFAMWFKTSGSALEGLQVVWGNTWGGGCDRIVGGGGGSATLNYNSWSEVNMSGGTVVNDGAWHHLAYVLDEANGFRAYIDGVLDVSSLAPTGNCGIGCSGFNWASDYWIGRGGGCRYGADYFAGLIDDVRMYDHVLSAAAVLQLYNTTR